MDFSTHKLPSRQSIVDNKTLKQSTVDYLTMDLRTRLNDQTLGERFVVQISNKLSESEIYNICEYAVRKGTHPGKLFVSICYKAMR